MTDDSVEAEPPDSMGSHQLQGLSGLQMEHSIAQVWKVAVGGTASESDGPTRVLTKEDFELHGWDLRPLSKPMSIPVPDRVWTSSELVRIGCGYMASMMEEKWHALVDGNCLRLHRSWTGYCIYEATLEECEGGTMIAVAFVEGD